jgi:uncharacterized membrane protein YbjE (DUF340 family)
MIIVDRVFVGETITIIGEIIVAVMVITVHHKVKNKHKIDKSVSSIMALEQVVGLLGVVMIIFGYFFEHWI